METLSTLLYEMTLVPSKPSEKQRLQELSEKCQAILRGHDIILANIAEQRDGLLKACKDLVYGLETRTIQWY
jgi:hypothetical protein